MRRFLLSGMVVFALAPQAHAGFEVPVNGPLSAFNPEGGIDLKLRGFVGYNSNVQFFNDFLLPLDIDPGSAFGGASATLDVWCVLTPEWTVGFAARGDLQGFADNTSSAVYPTAETEADYSFYAVSAKAYARHHTRFSDGTRLSLDGSIGVRKEATSNVEGVGELAFIGSFAATLDPVGPLAFSLSTMVSYDDFDAVWQLDTLNSTRDGWFAGIEGKVIYDVNLGPLQSVYVSAGVQGVDASGANWDYTGVTVGGGVNLTLTPQLSANAGASYTYRAYAQDFTSVGWFAAPGRQWQSTTSLNGQLVWQVMPNVAADFSLRHQFVNSNSSQFTGSQTIGTVGVTVDVY